MATADLVIARDELSRRVRNSAAESVETLLRQWLSLGHMDHLADVRRLVVAGEMDVDRFHCNADGAGLTLRHTTEMDGTLLRYTVTPTATP